MGCILRCATLLDVLKKYKTIKFSFHFCLRQWHTQLHLYTTFICFINSLRWTFDYYYEENNAEIFTAAASSWILFCYKSKINQPLIQQSRHKTIIATFRITLSPGLCSSAGVLLTTWTKWMCTISISLLSTLTSKRTWRACSRLRMWCISPLKWRYKKIRSSCVWISFTKVKIRY